MHYAMSDIFNSSAGRTSLINEPAILAPQESNNNTDTHTSYLDNDSLLETRAASDALNVSISSGSTSFIDEAANFALQEPNNNTDANISHSDDDNSIEATTAKEIFDEALQLQKLAPLAHLQTLKILNLFEPILYKAIAP